MVTDWDQLLDSCLCISISLTIKRILLKKNFFSYVKKWGSPKINK